MLSLVFSIYASYYDDNETTYWRPIVINYKALANIFTQIALDIETFISISSWVMIHPIWKIAEPE